MLKLFKKIIIFHFNYNKRLQTFDSAFSLINLLPLSTRLLVSYTLKRNLSRNFLN